MANDMQTFEDIFVVTWKWDRDENLVEAMTKMGGSQKDIDEYCSLKPTITFERRSDHVYLKFGLGFGFAYVHEFKFNEEFESKDHLSKPPSFHDMETATLGEDGVMTFISKTLLTGPGNIDTFSEFFVKNGELNTLVSPLDDRSYSGNRIYKRADNKGFFQTVKGFFVDN